VGLNRRWPGGSRPPGDRAGLDLRFASFKTVRRLQASPTVPCPRTSPSTPSTAARHRVGFNVGILESPRGLLDRPLYRHKVGRALRPGELRPDRTGNTAVDEAWPVPAVNQLATATLPTRDRRRGSGPAPGYWTVEADFQWTLWSTFDQVTIAFRAPAWTTSCPGLREHVARRLGVEYLIGDDWEIRAATATTTAPPHGDDLPFIHDADRHTFGRGELEVREPAPRLQPPLRSVPDELDLASAATTTTGATTARAAGRRVARLPLLAPGVGP